MDCLILGKRGVGKVKRESLKVIQMLPEFHEGGVERHVLWLSGALAKQGHEVMVVSKGGKLEKFLDEAVKVWHLPLHAKNPFTALWCALLVARRARKEGWQIIHAHSRVPFWIAWWASSFSGVPWVATTHDTFKHSFVLHPLKKACAAISVSHSVKEHLSSYLPERTYVIYNGLLPTEKSWQGSLKDDPFKFLFIGRLTSRKGLQVALKALAGVEEKWVLDVVGDGPKREELERLSVDLGIADKVRFWGFREDTDEWHARCSCFLFPSLEEGMGMTLMRAIQMGVPVLASDLPPVRELCLNPDTLLRPGDEQAWREALKLLLSERKSVHDFDRNKIRSVADMAELVFEVYRKCTFKSSVI